MSESRQASDRRGIFDRTLHALVVSLYALVVSGCLGLGLAQPASAQFVFEDAILPPRVVAWRLADRGFSGIARPRFDGRVYVVDAVNPAGVPVRLFVDPMAGAIVGRQRFGAPETYARLERPAPGFGWTEEESAPRRGLRALPPVDLSGPASRPARRPAVDAPRPDANREGVNPQGLNPDGAARPEAPRKVARAVQPSRQQPELKPAARTTPEAPAPKVAPIEAARSADKPEAPAAATGRESAPGGSQPAADDLSKPAGVRADASKAAAPDWKDPPVEGRKPVRVIGGATVVPGTADGKEPAKEAGQ